MKKLFIIAAFAVGVSLTASFGTGRIEIRTRPLTDQQRYDQQRYELQREQQWMQSQQNQREQQLQREQWQREQQQRELWQREQWQWEQQRRNQRHQRWLTYEDWLQMHRNDYDNRRYNDNRRRN